MKTSMQWAMEDAVRVKLEASVSPLIEFAKQVVKAMRPVLEALAEVARRFVTAMAQLQSSRAATVSPTHPAFPGAGSAVAAEQHSALGRIGQPGRRWRGRR